MSLPKFLRAPSKPSLPWTLAIVSIGLFMATLDNLVVTMALPSIQNSLGASIQSLEWTVNAYTLSFAVFLLTGAALGDRFGRRRMFTIGLSIFTLASAGAALATSADALIAARAIQGLGAAILLPLTLTLLSDAVPRRRRGMALGIWGGVSGLGVALGPLVGGAVISGISWHWIFWINVPIGLLLLPLAATRLSESRGPNDRLDLGGLLLAAPGLLGITYGAIRGQALGWTSPAILASFAVGASFLVGFAAWERHSRAPMLPMRFFRSRGFAATNGLSFAMYFGIFGSIFLLAQFFQIAQGFTPLEAGLRTLPWTGMPMIVAPIAGILSDRIGSRPLMALGLGLQAVAMAWLAVIISPDIEYARLVIPFMIAGTGMALVFAPSANAILASVKPEEAGQASGALNAIRELGGVMGVAVLATVFSAHGSYLSPQAFTDGLRAAIPIGTLVLTLGALSALLVPRTEGQTESGSGAKESAALRGGGGAPAQQGA